jgi:nucleoside-diphosphate-sugar epimerase
MRIVLTGASGFLGRPCLGLLVNRGHEVFALSRGPRPAGITGPVKWHVADLNAVDSYAAAIKAFAPQAALHLAWEGIPDYGLETSLRNLRNGALLGQLLFEAGCRHLAVSGSCWEYGKVSGIVHENAEPVAPGVFGASKSAQRLVLEALARSSNTTLAWGRVFYPYGPGQKPASLAPTICRAVLAGECPALKTPHAINDFLYVDDTAEALVMLAETSVSGAFNIGSGSGTPVGALADKLLSLADRPAAFAARAAQDGGSPAGFWADTAALRSLGWQPKMPLEEGLRRTLSFFKDAPASC